MAFVSDKLYARMVTQARNELSAGGVLALTRDAYPAAFAAALAALTDEDVIGMVDGEISPQARVAAPYVTPVQTDTKTDRTAAWEEEGRQLFRDGKTLADIPNDSPRKSKRMIVGWNEENLKADRGHWEDEGRVAYQTGRKLFELTGSGDELASKQIGWRKADSEDVDMSDKSEYQCDDEHVKCPKCGTIYALSFSGMPCHECDTVLPTKPLSITHETKTPRSKRMGAAFYQ